MHIEFYFDFLSAYSFLAWKDFVKFTNILGHPLNNKTIQFHLRPLSQRQLDLLKFGSNCCSNLEFELKDCLIRAKYRGQIFQTPHHIPFNSLPALGLVSSIQNEEVQSKLTDEFFNAAWEEGKDLEDDQTLQILTNKVLGHSSFDYYENVFRQNTLKQAIEENTERAKVLKIKHLPAFVFAQYVFSGPDALMHIVQCVKDPFFFEQVEHLFQELREKHSLA